MIKRLLGLIYHVYHISSHRRKMTPTTPPSSISGVKRLQQQCVHRELFYSLCEIEENNSRWTHKRGCEDTLLTEIDLAHWAQANLYLRSFPNQYTIPRILRSDEGLFSLKFEQFSHKRRFFIKIWPVPALGIISQ